MADIELVVKMPENTYRQIQALVRNGYFEHDICGNSMRRIANGTPLPKGHGDLKDQKDLAKSLYDYQWIDQLTYIEVTNRLINTPTIIEADKEQKDDNT